MNQRGVKAVDLLVESSIPNGTSESEIAEHEKAEAATATALVEHGHLIQVRGLTPPGRREQGRRSANVVVDPGMIYAFGRYELDLATYELRHSGVTVPVEPQVFNVLAYLVEHRDRVVSKEELLDNVWGDRFVGESALTSRIKTARRLIGDDGSRQTLIRTAHGRGYRFVGAIAGEAAGVEPAGVARHQFGVAGRREELAQLHERLARARDGDRQVVFVAGSPGIGKTTVVQEFLGSLPPDVLVGVGQCVELRGPGEAYLPVLAAIRAACGGGGGHALLERFVEFAPSWVLQLPGVVSPAVADALRVRSVGASGDSRLRELLDAVCCTGPDAPPLVLVVEDLQWSDGSTLDLLGALAADRRPAPLLVVATHRPGDGSTGQAVHALAVGLRLRQRASLITLDALAVDEVADLIAARMGGEGDTDLIELIHERTGGVPLFVEHLLDDWVRSGWLDVSSGSIVVTKPLAQLNDAIPDGVRLLIEHTTSRLSTLDQAALAAAAVAGPSFTSAEVSAATHQPDEDVEAVLSELGRRGAFVHADGETTWPDGTVTSSFAFDHDLYRDVLYRRVGPARAAAHHRRIGARLADAHRAKLSPLAASLAVHFTRGGDFDQAVRFRILAAEEQLQRSAHREAIDHLHTAAELLSRMPDDPAHVELSVHVQVALGNALLTANGYAAPETAAAYRHARELCDRLGDGPHLLPVLYGLWNASLVGGQPLAALEIAETFLALARGTHHPGIAVAHRAVAWPLLFLGQPVAALTHLEEIPAAFDATTTEMLIAGFGEDPAAAGSSVLAWARWFCGDEDGATAAIATALDRAGSLGHPLTETYVHTVAALLAQMRDDPDAALRYATAAVAIATKHGIPVFDALASTALAWATGRLNVGDGLRLQQDALAGMARTGTTVTLTAAEATLAELVAAAGDTATALVTLDEALALARRTGERYYEPELYRLKAELLATRGQIDAPMSCQGAIRRVRAAGWLRQDRDEPLGEGKLLRGRRSCPRRGWQGLATGRSFLGQPCGCRPILGPGRRCWSRRDQLRGR